MELLHEDDIGTLDMIIETCLEKGKASARDLPNFREDLLNIGSNKQYFYRRYLEIIIDSGTVIHSKNGYLEYTIEPKETITKRFIDAGGFKKLYEEQQEELRIKKILLEKDLDEAKVIKWTKKTYKLSVTIVVLSFIISIAALIVAILKP